MDKILFNEVLSCSRFFKIADRKKIYSALTGVKLTYKQKEIISEILRKGCVDTGLIHCDYSCLAFKRVEGFYKAKNGSTDNTLLTSKENESIINTPLTTKENDSIINTPLTSKENDSIINTPLTTKEISEIPKCFCLYNFGFKYASSLQKYLLCCLFTKKNLKEVLLVVHNIPSFIYLKGVCLLMLYYSTEDFKFAIACYLSVRRKFRKIMKISNYEIVKRLVGKRKMEQIILYENDCKNMEIN